MLAHQADKIRNLILGVANHAAADVNAIAIWLKRNIFGVRN
jgi:hypothetical protein